MGIFVLLPFILSILPCLLAVYWKRRNGLPWYLISVFLTYPIASFYVGHIEAGMGGSLNGGPPIMGGSLSGGSKLAATALCSIVSTTIVSLVVALLPQKKKSQEEPEITFRL